MERLLRAGQAAEAESPQRSVEALACRFRSVRQFTRDLAAPLSEADIAAQSMPDASPAKWHLAHTTWFFETFLLRDHVPGYQLADPRWPYLFNSYYEAEGARIARPDRGLLTRPSGAEVLAYRDHVDAALIDALPRLAERHSGLVELGIQHEQQHQELLLTDIRHLFSCNPLGPAYAPASAGKGALAGESMTEDRPAPPLRWIEGREGPADLGGDGEGFAFDNELPRHTAWLAPHALASRPVTNGEWIEFIADGGYSAASLWLSDGWDWIARERVLAPLYWRGEGTAWEHFTLAGWQPIDLHAPVSNVSLYEADAFAAWAGARLPTEHEWESAAWAHDPCKGIQLDAAVAAMPRAQAVEAGDGFVSLFGNVWEWTGSAYRPYPGYRTAAGAVGEYNGKFMSAQFVLRGGSCATPRGHVRASYRNFFHPHQRWQFSGLRLARSL